MPRVALIHDFLLDLRGAERVFAAICDAYPEADVFTAVYDEVGTEGRFAARDPQASFLQRLRPDRAHVPPAAAAVPARDRVAGPARLRPRRLVARAAWAHGVLVDPGAIHVCYCHNPFRYAWTRARGDARRAQPADPPAAARAAVALAPVGLDRGAAGRRLRRQLGDHRGADPALLRARGRRSCTRRSSSRASRPGPVGAHYLVLAELMAHKRIDVAIRAFNALGLPLVVVGDGPEWRRLRRLAGPTVRLTGRLSDGEVADLLRTARRSWSPRRRSSGSPRSSRWPPGGR